MPVQFPRHHWLPRMSYKLSGLSFENGQIYRIDMKQDWNSNTIHADIHGGPEGARLHKLISIESYNFIMRMISDQPPEFKQYFLTFDECYGQVKFNDLGIGYYCMGMDVLHSVQMVYVRNLRETVAIDKSEWDNDYNFYMVGSL